MCFELVHNGTTLRFGQDEFKSMFDVPNNGYSNYIVGQFPDSTTDYARLVLEFNHGNYPPNWPAGNELRYSVTKNGKQRYEWIHPYRGFLTGEEFIELKLIQEGVATSHSKDLRVGHNHMMLYLKFIHGEPINLPVIIAHHVNHTISNHKSETLPYGMLITAIMSYWDLLSGIPKAGLLPTKLDVISCKNFGLQLVNGVWMTAAQQSTAPRGDNLSEDASDEEVLGEDLSGQGPSGAGTSRSDTVGGSRRKRADKFAQLESGIEAVRRDLAVERKNRDRVFKNQFSLGKALSAIMRVILCQSKNEPIDEVALSTPIKLLKPLQHPNDEDTEAT